MSSGLASTFAIVIMNASWGLRAAAGPWRNNASENCASINRSFMIGS